jgi:hypothetical protein
MSDHLVDVRTPLAVSRHTRVEVGNDGVLHVLVGGVTLHLDRRICEELTTTLARAMVTLARETPRRKAPKLSLVPDVTEAHEGGTAEQGSLPERPRS